MPAIALSQIDDRGFRDPARSVLIDFGVSSTCWSLVAVMALAAPTLGAPQSDSETAAEAIPFLRDMAGNEHRFDSFADPNTRAVVFVFLDDNCPDSNRYLSTLKPLHDRYNAFDMDRRGKPIRRGSTGGWKHYDWPGDPVCFLGVYSRAPFLSIRDIARHALQNNIPFRVLQDPAQALMSRFGVAHFTEVRIWDPRQRRVLYAGPIDDVLPIGMGSAFPGVGSPGARRGDLSPPKICRTGFKTLSLRRKEATTKTRRTTNSSHADRYSLR